MSAPPKLPPVTRVPEGPRDRKLGADLRIDHYERGLIHRAFLDGERAPEWADDDELGPEFLADLALGPDDDEQAADPAMRHSNVDRRCS